MFMGLGWLVWGLLGGAAAGHIVETVEPDALFMGVLAAAMGLGLGLGDVVTDHARAAVVTESDNLEAPGLGCGLGLRSAAHKGYLDRTRAFCV